MFVFVCSIFVYAAFVGGLLALQNYTGKAAFGHNSPFNSEGEK